MTFTERKLKKIITILEMEYNVLVHWTNNTCSISIKDKEMDTKHSLFIRGFYTGEIQVVDPTKIYAMTLLLTKSVVL